MFAITIIEAVETFLRTKSSQTFFRLSKLADLNCENNYFEMSKTRSTPLHPLKYVETIDRYLYCPAVSQIYSLIDWPLMVTFFMRKSTVVTCVQSSLEHFLYINLQNKAVLPTLLSPTRISLYFFYYPKDTDCPEIISNNLKF